MSSSDSFREMAQRAAEIVAGYFDDLPNLPVMPATTSGELHELIDEPLPQEGSAVEDVLATVQNVIYPLCRHNGHPRFFGYVASPGTAAAAIGDFLAAGLNANVTAWRSAPAAAEIEHVVVDWLKALIGYPAGSAGLLVSGGSMANFSALAAARTAADPDVFFRGNYQGPVMRVYASSEAHFSIAKAAGLLGIGSGNIQSIPTDSAQRMNVDELERRIEADRNAGLKPMCIVANAGTVSTGAVDPIEKIADIAERQNVWLHVDGAYGGFAAAAPSSRHLFSGIERANSVSLDPHKWLYSSMGCGCILYRDPETATATFGHNAEYTRAIGLVRGEAFAFWDFGPELSRSFRALTVWLQIKLYGSGQLIAAIEKNMECARHFAGLVAASEDFEMLTPVGLSIFCFRYHPAGYAKDLDALNERVLIELQRSGSSYLSNARVAGSFALRGCVLNYRTTKEEVERLFRDVREAGRSVVADEAV